MRKSKIRVESCDLMQYFYRSAHDPIIHAYLTLDGRLNETALKQAVTLSTQAIPVIRCVFSAKASRPRWDDRGFAGEDMVHTVPCDPADVRQAQRLLSSTIRIGSEPQLKIFLLRGTQSDTLCVLINHMVCDGAGFKEYLYLLADLYTKCVRGEPIPPFGPPAPRGMGQIFAGFGFAKKVSILRAKLSLPKQNPAVIYRLRGDAKRPFFVTRRIEKEEFSQIHRYAKSRSATVNDIVLAAYARAVGRKTGAEHIVVPCPVDLRGCLASGRRHGICNLTSNYIYDAQIAPGDSFEATLRQASLQMRRQKEAGNCLKPVLLLDALFHILPLRVLQRMFHRVFKIPVLSYTNLGILKKEALRFGGFAVTGAFLTGAVKYVPYFQVAVSTFDGVMTLSCNLHGTLQDETDIAVFLKEMHDEMAGAAAADSPSNV